MGPKIEIIKEHEIADILWNPEYVDLFEEEWFRRAVNRLLYSPFHPKVALMQREYPLTVLEEIQNYFNVENQRKGVFAEVLDNLIKKLVVASGRMGLINKMMSDIDVGTFIVCQRADLEKLKEMFPEKVYEKFWLKSWTKYEPANLIVMKKVQFNDLAIDPFPKNLEKITILSDARHGDLIEALLSPLLTEEGRYLNLPDTELSNVPEIIKNLNSRYKSESFNDPYISALRNFKEKVQELKAERLRLYKKEKVKIEESLEDFQRKLDNNLILLQTTMLSSVENPPSTISSKTTTPNSEIWLGTTFENKYIALPVHTRIFIELIETKEIEEISPSEFDCTKHKLILLDNELFENTSGQRAIITRQLLEELSLEELIELNAFETKNGYKWENFGQLLLLASLMTIRFIQTADLIGDHELAKKIINHLRKEKIEEYSIQTLPSRWNKIEDWIELEEQLIPIPAGPERTAEKKTMKCLFEVLNHELGLEKEHEQDWGKCWLSVHKLQHVRRNYMKKTMAGEQCSYSINSWKKIIVNDEVPFYKILDEKIVENS